MEEDKSLENEFHRQSAAEYEAAVDNANVTSMAAAAAAATTTTTTTMTMTAATATATATFRLDGDTYTIVASPPDKSADQKQSEASSATAATPAAAVAVAAATSAATVTTATSMTATAATVATVERFGKYSGQSASVSAPPSNETQTMGAHNGQLSKQGSLTIVRRSSTKKSPPSGKYFRRGTSVTIADDDALDQVDLNTDNLPAVDTPDACDKAALRLRCLLRQLQKGEISAELLQKNLRYAAKVLEAMFVDETKDNGPQYVSDRDQFTRCDGLIKTSSQTAPPPPPPPPSPHAAATATAAAAAAAAHQRRRLRTPVWARRLVDEDDELSEVQPDAVPPEVREWLASTFTRQLATSRRRTDEKPKFRSVAHAIRAGIFVDRIYRKVTNAALMQFPAEVVRVLKTLDEWSFDIFDLSDASCNQPLKYLGYDLLNRYGIFHKFKVPPAVVEYFLTRVEEGYYKFKNPYHNNLHAADVAQCIHWMLYQTGLMNWLTDLEIFATLVAAIVHDYEHTGTTNNFHVMSGSDTALLYNDRAVLENHHISATFRLMKEDECNILQHLSREEYREFRTLVIDMVLATDMSFHFQQLKNMRNLLTLAEPFMDKSKALSLVLHCCDISHPAKRWDLHRQWTARLLEEFFRQGDKERDLGLPFSPLCDRNNTLVAESQIGFIDFIVEPSMAVCGDMLEIIVNALNSPSAQIASGSSQESASMDSSGSGDAEISRIQIKKPWVQCLADNKRRWKEQATKEAAVATANATSRAIDRHAMEDCLSQEQLEDIAERIEDQ